MLLDWLEVMIGDVPTNIPPEVRAFLARVAKMEAGQGPRQIYILDRVVKARYWRVGVPRHPAIESEGDPIGSKERGQRRRHCGAVEGVCSWVLG